MRGISFYSTDFRQELSYFQRILQSSAYIIIKLLTNREYNIIFENQLFSISFRSHIFRSNSEIIVKYEFNHATG